MRLFLAGDVMTGRGIDQIMRHPVDPAISESYMRSAEGYVELAERRSGSIPRNVDDAYIWGDVLEELAAAAPDLRIVNLETAVTARGTPWPGKAISYRMHPRNLGVLQAAAIDACSLANNHVLDWSYPGLDDTLNALDAAGVGRAGAGRNRADAEAPAILGLGAGLGRVVMLAIGSGTAGVPDAWAAGDRHGGVAFVLAPTADTADLVAHRIAEVRRPRDVVVLSIHWGPNWGHRVTAAEREFAHRVIDAGVDIVHGHSSHHAKALEVYRDRLVMYGCGDLINDYEGIGGHEEYRGDLGLAYEVDLGPDGLESVEMAAFQMRRFRAERVTGSTMSWLADTLDRHSRPLGTRVHTTGDARLGATW